MAQKKKSRVVLTVILILAIAILIFAAYQLISIFLEYQRGESEYHDLAVQYVSPIASSIVEEETAAPVTVDFESLQS